ATTFVVSAPIWFHGVTGMQMLGSGTAIVPDRGTVFKWTGNSTDPLLKLTNVMMSNFANFQIAAFPSNPLAAGIYSERGEHSQRPPSNNSFERIFISSNPLPGNFDKGIQIACGSGGDGNNDMHKFT